MTLTSAFHKTDFEMAYMAAFVALGVSNLEMAVKLAELTHEAADVMGAVKEMRLAISTHAFTLEPYPGAVNRALDYLRPKHEAWVAMRAADAIVPRGAEQ